MKLSDEYIYEITKEVEGVIDPSLPLMSNLANVSAILNQLPDINWVGFYIADGDYLYLGPFQGEVACTKIPYGHGVCGSAYSEAKTIIVDDVDEFPGHIACSSKSKSEIVTPIIKDYEVVAVIDIDAPIYNRFNSSDQKLLEKVADILKEIF